MRNGIFMHNDGHMTRCHVVTSASTPHISPTFCISQALLQHLHTYTCRCWKWVFDYSNIRNCKMQANMQLHEHLSWQKLQSWKKTAKLGSGDSAIKPCAPWGQLDVVHRANHWPMKWILYSHKVPHLAGSIALHPSAEAPLQRRLQLGVSST